MPQKGDEIEQIGRVKGPVFEFQQPPEIGFPVLQHELIGRPIQELHQLPRLINDSRPVAPGKDSRKETGDLYILPKGISMRDAYRVVDYK